MSLLNWLCRCSYFTQSSYFLDCGALGRLIWEPAAVHFETSRDTVCTHSQLVPSVSRVLFAILDRSCVFSLIFDEER